MKYIFAKSCVITINFAYIFWDIFAKIYLTCVIPRPSKYIFMPKKLYMSHIYFHKGWRHQVVNLHFKFKSVELDCRPEC